MFLEWLRVSKNPIKTIMEKLYIFEKFNYMKVTKTKEIPSIK